MMQAVRVKTAPPFSKFSIFDVGRTPLKEDRERENAIIRRMVKLFPQVTHFSISIWSTSISLPPSLELYKI